MGSVTVKDLKKLFISKTGDPVLAIESVCFDVKDKEFVCILGPSGCGKTTILNLIGGVEDLEEGEIRIGDKRVEANEKSLQSIGYVFQEPRLLPWRTVEDNLRFVLSSKNVPKAKWTEIIDFHLNMVGLSQFRKSYPYQLSGGMKQRASLARAFAVKPEILLMDEPFSGLDEITARHLRKELLEIWAKERTTILFVTHNCFEATFLADRILVMTERPGKIHEEIKVDLPRPRMYDNVDLFKLSSKIVSKFVDEIDLF